MYHCNDCHAATAGYSAVAPLVRGRTWDMNVEMIEHLDEGHFFMPPWAGTRKEAELLADYLETIALGRPAGMLPERPAPPKK
jgi:mono/diheme cytochrome c family protein